MRTDLKTFSPAMSHKRRSHGSDAGDADGATNIELQDRAVVQYRYAISDELPRDKPKIPLRPCGSCEPEEPVIYPSKWAPEVEAVLKRRGDQPVRLYADGKVKPLDSVYLVVRCTITQLQEFSTCSTMDMHAPWSRPRSAFPMPTCWWVAATTRLRTSSRARR